MSLPQPSVYVMRNEKLNVYGTTDNRIKLSLCSEALEKHKVSNSFAGKIRFNVRQLGSIGLNFFKNSSI